MFDDAVGAEEGEVFDGEDGAHDGAFAAGLIGSVAMQFENLCVGEERDVEIHRFFRVAFEEEKRLDLRVGHW